MIFTKAEAHFFYLDVVKELGQFVPNAEKLNKVAGSFLSKYGLDQSMYKSIWIKFSRLVNEKKSFKLKSKEKQNIWEKDSFIEIDPPAPAESNDRESRKNRGRPSAVLGESPCRKTTRSILNEAVRFIEKFAIDQSISKEEALDLVSKECRKEWGTPREEVKKQKVPCDVATAMIYNMNISTRQYQMQRSISLPYVTFPTRNEIDVSKGSYHPKIFSFQLKACVDIKELLAETALALLDLTSFNYCHFPSSIQMIGKFGVDGSGSHKIRQQLVDSEIAFLETPHLDHTNTSTILLSCYCPLELRDMTTDKLIWENPLPNSNCYARPVSLSRCKEDRDRLQEELKSCFDVIKTPYNFMPNELSNITCTTKCSMVDGKMVGLLQGDTGAFCHMCDVTRVDANDMMLIHEGFHINKDYESCKLAWTKLNSGNISYQSSERKGQCHEPIVQSDLFCFSILHHKLRSLDFVQKILYHLVAGQKTWSETGNITRYIKVAKQNCIDSIREKTAMLIDSPCGTGGNTNSGPIADRFFSEKDRPAICSLILNQEDRDNYAILLSKVNVFLSITQAVTSKRVNPEKLKILGIELMVHIKSSFLDERGNPWIMIIPSVHQMCAHSWELFKINNGTSISKWSENPLESWNKYVRSFQSGPAARARQCSVKDNLKDVFTRMVIRSHPAIADKYPRPLCSLCGEVGHTARSIRHRRLNVPTCEKTTIDSVYEL